MFNIPKAFTFIFAAALKPALHWMSISSKKNILNCHCLHSPIIWSRTQYPLSEWRPANMKHFSQVPSEDLQGLIRAGGQVVHADIFILAARCYHIPTKSKRQEDVYKTVALC